MQKTWKMCALLVAAMMAVAAEAATSVAGLFPLAGSGRVVYNFNQGWRFHRGDVAGAEAVAFDDGEWEVVCAPHTAMLTASEGSGCRNYQGVVWYRKHFTVPSAMSGRQVLVHFEAIMGKQAFYVNGSKVREHRGGYLPVTIDLTACGVKAGETCVLAVMADNTDDKSYPPGKKQVALDFAYHGGMYRDVWLIGKQAVAISDANEAGLTAGGGVFVHYDNISERRADVLVKVDVVRHATLSLAGGRGAVPVTVTARLCDKDGRTVGTSRQRLSLAAGARADAELAIAVKQPRLWSPEAPYLYDLDIMVEAQGRAMDGGTLKAGIRKAEFRGRDGFWLNGRPYKQLVGGNRHQDFALVGNAVPNSQQWRDARRLKDAGMNIVRAAHYPQDPAFMDALDELGIFIIVPTPGWQYWNKAEGWDALVHENTRQMVRRDRNHPCVLMWEPILNETRYPEDFALQALQITREEYPYEGRPVAAADLHSAGVAAHYDVLYDWPENVVKAQQSMAAAAPQADTLPAKPIFTREFGEMVDDWYAHNCLNRASRGWGEKPMLTAALSLADTYGTMFQGQRQFVGGCQWHPFDHQRGYHPDPYYGGIYDAFRQKKYAFEMFRAQGTDEPMVFIANEMTPFSDEDVVVFSNCDSVRLSFLEGDRVQTRRVESRPDGQPHAPVVFPKMWDFWAARDYSYKQRNWQRVQLVAEGYRNGSIVATEKKMPSRRSTRIRLMADEMGRKLTADGSDFVVVVAEITDDNGNVRRLAKENIVFTVEGEGRIIGDAAVLANPRAVEWGSAPILVQSTNRAGRITVTARSQWAGTYAPAADTLVIESVAPDFEMCYTDRPAAGHTAYASASATLPAANAAGAAMSDEEKRRTLLEVEQQQKDFGVK